ncbi:MAG: hypothetical protein KJ737_12995 [Proteobacteria bacterium]|nr:hypothetical protein [Pseudomonadota bacterium]
MKVGYKKAIEVLYNEYKRLQAENGNPEEIKGIREGIEYLCYPFKEDLTEDIRSPLQDPNDPLYLDKADRSTPAKEKAFWEKMTTLSRKNIDVALYALDILKKL